MPGRPGHCSGRPGLSARIIPQLHPKGDVASPSVSGRLSSPRDQHRSEPRRPAPPRGVPRRLRHEDARGAAPLADRCPAEPAWSGGTANPAPDAAARGSRGPPEGRPDPPEAAGGVVSPVGGADAGRDRPARARHPGQGDGGAGPGSAGPAFGCGGRPFGDGGASAAQRARCQLARGASGIGVGAVALAPDAAGCGTRRCRPAGRRACFCTRDHSRAPGAAHRADRRRVTVPPAAGRSRGASHPARRSGRR